MSTRIIFLSVILISFNLFAGQATSDVSCSFQNSTSSIVFKNLKSGNQTGTSPLKEALFTIDGKNILKTSVSALSLGRSSWVEGDLNDDRPAAVIDFQNESALSRLAIYYCSGDGKTVSAKLFFGKAKKQKASNFESSQIVEGFCSGNQTRDVFTSDCSAFK